MPFPWKKAKVTRISRLVADLHQSPKRGGSLVVETGFPTSLIDLFVKNRDRLRKPSKRKSNSSSQIQSPPSNQSSSPPESPLSPPPEDEPPPPSPSSSAGIDAGSLAVDVRTECEKRISFCAAFKIFLAVALAVSTRFLAVRIMVLAFLLLIIEFVGRRFFMKPESKNLFLESWVRKGCLVLKGLDWKQTSSKQEIIVDLPGSNELGDNCLDEIAASEIHPIDKSCESENQIGSIEMQVTVEKKEKRRKMLISKTERARIKANLIKKLVPKKIRNGKKSKNQDESCSQSVVQLDKLAIIKEEKQVTNVNPIDDEQEAETETGTGKENFKQEGVGEVSEQILKVGSVMEKINNETKVKRSGYLILFMIVLGGLVGGKGAALLLTLVWCLMLRYIGRTRRCSSVLSEIKV